MEFNIKKNGNLPILKMAVVKDGRNDYQSFMDFIETSSLFFSMDDSDTGANKIHMEPAGFVEKTFIDPNTPVEYYVYFKFQKKHTSKVGRFEGQFTLRNDSGTLILPIREQLFINVEESFNFDEIPTPTVTPTIPPTPTITPTPTVTPTVSPIPTPSVAYLFIEPFSGSSLIGQWMFNLGLTFFGFTNASQPTQIQNDFNIEMNNYVDFTGWTNNLFPSLITQEVPQTSGGDDDYGNPIVAYNFKTTKVTNNTINGNAWYTWIIPTNLTNNQTQREIDLNTSSNPNSFTTVSTEPTINQFTFTYTGNTITQGTYKVYTTYPDNTFNINDNDDIYFKGNTVT